MATKTSATQTSSWDMDLDKALAKVNEEMSTFHSRLARVEQRRLESIACHRSSENAAPLPQERNDPANVTWSGSNPSNPPF